MSDDASFVLVAGRVPSWLFESTLLFEAGCGHRFRPVSFF